jgi:hypothetical protein
MSQRTRAVGVIIVSAALLAAGLWVLLDQRGDASLQKLAAGWVGAVAGYWLK